MTGGTTPGRNEKCSCGSGRKYKQCCGAPGQQKRARGSSAATVENLLALAIRFQKAGQTGAAIGPLLEIVRVDPRHSLATQGLGSIYLHSGQPKEAVTWLRKATTLAPTVGETYLELGVALEQTGDREEALVAYRRAAILAPYLQGAHLQIANLLVALGSPADAAAAYEAARARGPHTPIGELAYAKALLLRGLLDDAEKQLRRMTKSETRTSEASLLLGILLSEQGHFEDARSAFEHALTLAPDNATALHGIVSSGRVTERERSVVDRVVLSLGKGDLGDPARAMLHFAAGKGKDDLGDYAGAMEHFVLANRIRRRLARPFHPRSFDDRVSTLIAQFTKEYFAKHRELGSNDETPTLVLGMPRSGTTLVERILSSHPSVAAGGEIIFWNTNAPRWLDTAGEPDKSAAEPLTRAYLETLREVSPTASFVVDKMPFNFLWIGVIHSLFSRARIVHCQRHPIDTCLSIYSTHFSQPWGFASDLSDLAAYYRAYERLMAHWRDVLPADRFLDVRYEDVIACPDAASKRLIAFLGLEWDDACGAPERSVGVVRTASKWQARQPIFQSSVERYRHYEPWLGDLMSLA